MQQKPKPQACVPAAGASASTVTGAASGSRLGWRASSYNTEIEICMVLRYGFFSSSNTSLSLPTPTTLE